MANGNRRRRVAPVPAIAFATPIGRGSVASGSSDTGSSAGDIDTFQRSFDAVSSAAQKAASHPTLRDAVVATRVMNGVNRIEHGLGRLPRLVYVTFLDMPDSWLTWYWLRQSGDADRDFVQIAVNSDPAASGYVGHGIGSDGAPTGSLSVGKVNLPALVRIE